MSLFDKGEEMTLSSRGNTGTRSSWVVLLGVLALALSVPPAHAVVLDFEGLANAELVANFYNGGLGGNSSGPGPNFGITFSNARALIDADAGGSGNFANEPSPNTTMLSAATMNVLGGFTTAFSFSYSTSVTAAFVKVYAGLDATGNILATTNLVAQFDGNNCTGDPTGAICNWTAVAVLFSGTAMSVEFGGLGGALYDNITLTPGSGSASVPEPGSLLLVGSGLAGLGAFTWRRHHRK